MPEYTIKRVSQQEPRIWKGPHGKVFYIKVELEGHDKPVSIGKKAPDALKAGDTVYGKIIDAPEYEVDNFKADKPQEQSSCGYTKSPEDKEDIARAVAWKSAILYYAPNRPETFDDIAELAEYGLAWLKGGKPATGLQEQPGVKDEVHDVVEGEPVDLSEIPF